MKYHDEITRINISYYEIQNIMNPYFWTFASILQQCQRKRLDALDNRSGAEFVQCNVLLHSNHPILNA